VDLDFKSMSMSYEMFCHHVIFMEFNDETFAENFVASVSRNLQRRYGALFGVL